MNDDELMAAWTTLHPTTAARRHIDTRLAEWLEARDTSIAAEWLAMFKIAPFATLGLATVSAISIAAAPLMWLLRTVT